MQKNIFVKTICFSFFLVFLGGCTFFTHYDELMTLKRMGDNQAQITKYLDKQKALFLKLLDDAKFNRLEKGSSRKTILTRYGEPIYVRQDSETEGSEVYVYRHPTEYFSSDLVNLYFNKNKKLTKWQILSAESEKSP
jgi:hypothetical protein